MEKVTKYSCIIAVALIAIMITGCGGTAKAIGDDIFVEDCGDGSVFNFSTQECEEKDAEGSVTLPIKIDATAMLSAAELEKVAVAYKLYAPPAGIYLCGKGINYNNESPAACVNYTASIAAGTMTANVTVRAGDFLTWYYIIRATGMDWQKRCGNITIGGTLMSRYSMRDVNTATTADNYDNYCVVSGWARVDASGGYWVPNLDPTLTTADINRVRVCYTGISAEQPLLDDYDINADNVSDLVGTEQIFQQDTLQYQALLTNSITDNQGVWSAGEAGFCMTMWDVIDGTYLAINAFRWETDPLAPAGSVDWLLHASYAQFQNWSTGANIGARTELHYVIDKGSCSNATLTTRATCEAALATWTPWLFLTMDNINASATAPTFTMGADNRSFFLAIVIPVP